MWRIGLRTEHTPLFVLTTSTDWLFVRSQTHKTNISIQVNSVVKLASSRTHTRCLLGRTKERRREGFGSSRDERQIPWYPFRNRSPTLHLKHSLAASNRSISLRSAGGTISHTVHNLNTRILLTLINSIPLSVTRKRTLQYNTCCNTESYGPIRLSPRAGRTFPSVHFRAKVAP